MLIRIMLILFLVVGLAGFGGVAWVSTHGAAAGTAKAVTVQVAALTVARALPAGSLLKPDDLAVRSVLQSALPAGGNIDTPETRRSLNGAMLRRGIGVGDLVLSEDVTRPGDHGFLAAVLMAGMRAVTVGVDAISGTAGLIWPGDRIDVIMTQSLEGADVPQSRRVSAETVLHDVRVIAIDQRMFQGAAPSDRDGPMARTVTLEVTEDQASRVAVAMRIGRLSLSVRAALPEPPGGPVTTRSAVSDAVLPVLPSSPKSANNTGETQLIWAGDVSHALPNTEVPHAEVRTLRVFQGSSDGKDYRF